MKEKNKSQLKKRTDFKMQKNYREIEFNNFKDSTLQIEIDIT